MTNDGSFDCTMSEALWKETGVLDAKESISTMRSLACAYRSHITKICTLEPHWRLLHSAMPLKNPTIRNSTIVNVIHKKLWFVGKCRRVDARLDQDEATNRNRNQRIRFNVNGRWPCMVVPHFRMNRSTWLWIFWLNLSWRNDSAGLFSKSLRSDISSGFQGEKSAVLATSFSR